MTTAIEADADAYADAEMARIDTDPSRSDIECWEHYLGIDSDDIRTMFDERLVMKRAGIDVEPPFNENDRGDAEAIARTVYAEFAAEQRNPAPRVPMVPPPAYTNEPNYAADLARLDAIVIKEAFSRAALRSHFYRQRRDALRAEAYEAEREQQRERERRDRLATPVVIEGELIPATPRPTPATPSRQPEQRKQLPSFIDVMDGKAG